MPWHSCCASVAPGAVCAGLGALRLALLRSLVPLKGAAEGAAALVLESDVGAAFDFWTSVVFGRSCAVLAPASRARLTAIGTASSGSVFMPISLITNEQLYSREWRAGRRGVEPRVRAPRRRAR